MKLIHSLWTKPALNERRWGRDNYLWSDIYMQALSCLYVKQLKENPEIVLHTDSYGAELLRDLPYDSIRTTLDDMPEDTPMKLFSQGKIMALQNEPLGTIHIDNDVFLKSDLTIDAMKGDWDAICQQIEIKSHNSRYKENIKLLGDINEFQDIWANPESAFCGIIGIRNPQLFKEFTEQYYKLLDIIKQPEVLSKFKESHKAPDLTLEQSNLKYVIDKGGYKLQTLFDEYDSDECKRMGFEHLFYKQKYEPSNRTRVMREIQRLDPVLFDKLNEKYGDKLRNFIRRFN